MVFHLPGSFLNGPKNCLAQTLHPPTACGKSDGIEKLPCAQTLHPPTACDKSDGAPDQMRSNEHHPYQVTHKIRWCAPTKVPKQAPSFFISISIRWSLRQKVPKWAPSTSSHSRNPMGPGRNKPNRLHPHRNRSKSDGSNRHQMHKSAKKAPQKPPTRSLQ